VERLARRGKYLVWALEDEAFLLMHLRMTGTLLYDAPPGTPYERVRWTLDDGHELRFCDPRRFGTGELALGTPAREAFFAARLGLEPLDGELTGEALRRMARGRRAPVKAFLLDQRRIAGVGNIYADESLFRARIHPLCPAGSLTRVQCDALAQAVREALHAGLAAGGASIDDFRHADGVKGAFQDEFLVHLRRGEPCPRCGTPVVKFVAAGRGTYACERCQPRPRRRRARRPAP
jgi:formamidopyrimidine-DNA glycosylase